MGSLRGSLLRRRALWGAFDVFLVGVRMRVAGEPLFSCGAIGSDMNELRALAGTIEDPHRADRGTFDH
jgi:hypothetical protein